MNAKQLAAWLHENECEENICALCAFIFADCGDHRKGLKIERGMRPSPAKIEKMHVARGTAQKAAEKFQRDWLAKNTAEHSLWPRHKHDRENPPTPHGALPLERMWLAWEVAI